MLDQTVAQQSAHKTAVTRLQLFIAFSRISLSSFGGAIFWARRELVEVKGHPGESIRAAAYWKRGAQGHHENL